MNECRPRPLKAASRLKCFIFVTFLSGGGGGLLEKKSKSMKTNFLISCQVVRSSLSHLVDLPHNFVFVSMLPQFWLVVYLPSVGRIDEPFRCNWCFVWAFIHWARCEGYYDVSNESTSFSSLFFPLPRLCYLLVPFYRALSPCQVFPINVSLSFLLSVCPAANSTWAFWPLPASRYISCYPWCWQVTQSKIWQNHVLHKSPDGTVGNEMSLKLNWMAPALELG